MRSQVLNHHFCEFESVHSRQMHLTKKQDPPLTINELPPDVLYGVFSQALGNDLIELGGKECRLFALGKICSRWRALLHESPSLWSRFKLQMDPDERNAGVITLRVKSCLENSKSAPLSVSFGALCLSEDLTWVAKFKREVLVDIAHHANRLHLLSLGQNLIPGAAIIAQEHEFSQLKILILNGNIDLSMFHSARQLEELTLRPATKLKGASKLPKAALKKLELISVLDVDLCQGANQLEEVTLKGLTVPMSASKITWKTLKKLSLSNIHTEGNILDGMLSMFAELSNLEELCIFSSFQIDPPNATASAIQTVTLPSLLTLMVYNIISPCTNAVFPFLRAPKLINLHIREIIIGDHRKYHENCSNVFYMMEQSSSKLRRLHLRVDEKNRYAQFYTPFFQQLGDLQELRIITEYSGKDLPEMLTHLIWDNESGCFPLLQKLELYLEEPYSLSDKISQIDELQRRLADVMQSRSHCSRTPSSYPAELSEIVLVYMYRSRKVIYDKMECLRNEMVELGNNLGISVTFIVDDNIFGNLKDERVRSFLPWAKT